MLAFKRLCACFKNEILFLEEAVLESTRRGGLVKNAPCRNISFGYLSENPTRGSPVQNGGASILKFWNKSQKSSEVKEITEKSSFKMGGRVTFQVYENSQKCWEVKEILEKSSNNKRGFE
jgi:hypothetical protein